jgi:ABC-type lipoprotein release transport system permease subunit
MLGMFLAAFGLYGVIAYLANRRRHEIGIRMAPGAESRSVLRLVLGQGLKLAALGTGIGLLVSLGAMRLLSNPLYGVKPTDPLAFVSSATIVILVATAASYFTVTPSPKRAGQCGLFWVSASTAYAVAASLMKRPVSDERSRRLFRE